MAQLGARLNGIQKVRGSNPLISITKTARFERFFFVHFLRHDKSQSDLFKDGFGFFVMQRFLTGMLFG